MPTVGVEWLVRMSDRLSALLTDAQGLGNANASAVARRDVERTVAVLAEYTERLTCSNGT